MVDFKYLYQGLCGLANSHAAGTMAGHLGAAVVTGYFIGEDHPHLAPEVYRGVEGELKRIEDGEEAIWFNAAEKGMTPSQLFQALPDEPADATRIESIAATLQEQSGTLIESGHNTIFASIAIRALKDHPLYATPSMVTGIQKLIEAFRGKYPGRGYYGKAMGWQEGDKVELPADETLADYHDVATMVRATLDEVMASAAMHRQGYGGLWHVINHAAAIAELERFGYRDIAQAAFAAHRQHLRLWRSLPDVAEELGPVEKSAHDPFEPEYWHEDLKRDQAQLTHRIKTIYGFHTLLRHVEAEPLRKLATDAFHYLMK